MTKVLPLPWRIDPNSNDEPNRGAAIWHSGDGCLSCLASGESRDGERLAPGEPERDRRCTVCELERQNPHADEIRAMNPLVALRDHRSDTEELRSLAAQSREEPAP